MDIVRVKHSRSPAYPDREAEQQEPELLLASPERWKRNAAACAALAATSAMLLAACSERTATEPAATQVPLFEHGKGWGTIACVAVNPPLFLTEEDACVYIKEIAQQNGLDFDDELMITTTIPAINWDKDTAYSDILTGKSGELQLDGYDKAKKIAFEYVSTVDIQTWRESRPEISATGYPIIDAARMLSDHMARAEGGTTVGVFYDPVSYLEEPTATDSFNLTDEQIKQLKEQSKEQLRQQVLDFIAWLKAEGII